VIESFKYVTRMPLAQTLVCTPALHHSTRQRFLATVNGLPRCRARVIAQGKKRVSNPETQAQNVLMKNWKITSGAHSPDADALQAYNDLYNSSVGSSKRKAMRAMFRACLDPVVDPMEIEP
jgi:hypothetical protein